MRRTCIRSGISTLFLFIYFAGFSQNSTFDTAAFYKHLVSENLFSEQIAFNHQIIKLHPANTLLKDSLYLNISLAYTRLGNTDSVNANLSRISPTPVFSNYASGTYLSLLVLYQQYDKANGFSVNSKIMPLPFASLEADLAIKMLERKPTLQDTAISMISPQLRNIKTEYENAPHHSAFLAGLFSAVIPGMGKLYLGYSDQALSGFIANAALGAQAAESYFKAGPASARFIISGSLFGLFYGGNIWGSIIMAKKQKRDHLKQIDYEIFNYYNSAIGNSPK
jgi:hypothetical protein